MGRFKMQRIFVFSVSILEFLSYGFNLFDNVVKHTM